MKCLRRYFCVLLCCVLSLGVFSVSVSAADVDKPLYIYQYHKMPNISSFNGLTFYPNNAEKEIKETTRTYGNTVPSGLYQNVFTVRTVDESSLIEGGRNVKVKFENIYFSILYELGVGEGATMMPFEQKYITEPTSVYAIVMYADGSTTSISSNALNVTVKKDKTINIDFEFTPKKDVQQISFNLCIDDISTVVPTADTIKLTFYSGEYNGDDKFQFSFDVSSEEAGLLKGIIEWLKGIKDGITNLFNSITELPQKIWSFIENGLKSLFVPSEDFIVQYKTDMDTMLSQKLGAVYQVTSILTNGWDRITASDTQNTINIPKTTIPLPNNNSFSFGGYDVQIVPNGFEFIVDILKTVIGIVCTIMCVNSLRKKYDEVMGVEK